ncbi:recombinase family protein [Nocardioides halotolerans]|uniref:recombinase family protein n=1 Tax=Nocardioides halotolerans TaxID=433660 RepID=UPI0003F4F0F8|nr:recombinase family protein [Nocardioides halotolerans]
MTKPRAAIYCRISRDAEQEGLGVARQEEDCRKLAKRAGFSVIGVYTDNDISASTKSRKPRPSYNRLLADARAGRIDAILAYSNSRLTRRPAEWIDLINLANEGRVRVKTVASGEHDLSTADGRAVALTVAAWDAAEAERTAERVTRAHAQLAVNGAHIGPRPFGWDFTEDKRLVINPAEAAVVRECVQRVLAGEGIWKITRDLNERGVRTSTGKTWATQVLRRMLLRWRNCGVRTHHGKEAGPGQWEALYDRELHERLVAFLTNPARRSNNRGTEAKYLLTSVALCGECGEFVVGTNAYDYTLKNGRVRHYPHSYKCPHAGCMKVQRNMDDVDDHVTRVVLALLERDGVKLLGGDPIAADAARERIAALEAKLALTADQFADDAITGEQLQRITGRLRPQLDAERDKLRRAQPDAELADYAGPGVTEAWAKTDVETKKRIVRLLGMRITIHRIGPGNARAYDPSAVTITHA